MAGSDNIQESEQFGATLGTNDPIQPTPRDLMGLEKQDKDSNIISQEAIIEKPKWNSSRLQVCRVFTVFAGFMLLGMNDSALGALVISLEDWYDKTYTIVSVCMLMPTIGFISASFLNTALHNLVGRLGVSIIGVSCLIIAFSLECWAPPFPLLVVAYAIGGVGSGTIVAAWNVFIVSLENENELMGILHGFYGAGAILSPVIATALISTGVKWSYFYCILLGYGVFLLTSVVIVFRTESASKYRTENESPFHGTEVSQQVNSKNALVEALNNKYTILACMFLFCYMGLEVSIGNWTVTFMVTERAGKRAEMGTVGSGFWIGFTVGRIVLGFITGRIGENVMITVYFIFAIGFQLLYWLDNTIVGSAVGVALVGFFIGPMFPTAILAISRILPIHLHVAGVGFASAIGGAGSAVFPFITGAIAGNRGVWVLQPIALSLLIFMSLLWIVVPTIESSGLRDKIFWLIFRREANSVVRKSPVKNQ
ncbi:major facilitator superfamily domain-containing protein [Lipomyces oligophaga]|uniref:major facilitator superfamily domain-containing protein n=1 Tax=Lipomyces oligophaga TaxID=45792 RepID=UPI0034CDF18D